MANKKKVNIPNMILALFLAIGLWTYCIVEINPTSDVTIKGVPINYVGMQELENSGLAILSERPETLSVTIGGQRAAISKVKAGDFSVICDLENLQEGENRVSISVAAPGGIQVENQSIKSLSLTVDKIVTAARDIVGVIVNQDADGDVAKILSISKTTVNVTGPKSVLSTVDKVVAKVDATMLGNQPVILQVPLEAVDSEGKTVDGVTMGRAFVSCKAILVSSVIVDPLDDPDIGDENIEDVTGEDENPDGDITEPGTEGEESPEDGSENEDEESVKDGADQQADAEDEADAGETHPTV